MALAITGTGNGSLNNLALSANTGTVIDTAKSGTFIQLVNFVLTTDFTTTSTSFVDVTNYTLSITPTSSSNKVFCLVDYNVRTSAGSTTPDCRTYTRLLRGASTVVGFRFSGAYIANYSNTYIPTSMMILDSPATTSTVTYKLQMFSTNASYTSGILGSTDTTSITLIEVAA